MMLLVLCLVGTAWALPVIPEAPTLEKGDMYIASGPIIMAYAAPSELAPLKKFEVRIEPIPKEEGFEITEPNSELPELLEPEGSKVPVLEEPKEEETVIIKLSPPRFFTVPSFISDWFSFLPSSITNLFNRNSSSKLLYPGYTVLVEPPKPEN